MNFINKYKTIGIGLAVFAIVSIFFLLLISSVIQKENEAHEQKLFSAHQNAIQEIKSSIENLNIMTSGIRSFVKQSNSDFSDSTFLKVVQTQLENTIYKDSVSISLVDTTQHFKFSVSRSQINPAGLVGMDVMDVVKLKDFIQLNNILKNEGVYLMNPFNVYEGWAGISMNHGVHKKNTPYANISVVINVQHILNNIYTDDYKDFTHKFVTNEGHEFDRFAVYNGTEKNLQKDPENYLNFKVNDEDFVNSNIEFYGLKLKIATAYKTPPIKESKFHFYISFIVITSSIFYLIYQSEANRQLNLILESLSKKQKKDHLGVVESINYAKRIQSSFISKEAIIKENFNDLFIFFKPKDIVSGDFYWYNEVNGKKIIAAIDCTGHGVPGALMTSIANGLLNNIILGDKILNPGLILEELDSRIVALLNQEKEGSQDGMDVAICVIDEDEKTLSFAGAFRPLLVIKNEKLTEYKGDRFSIGGANLEISREYKTHIIEYNKEDTFYIFSDGYPDQFGGENNKKFMTKNLKDLLLSIQAENMKTQKKIISDSFNNWKGKTEQTDDVILIGFRL